MKRLVYIFLAWLFLLSAMFASGALGQRAFIVLDGTNIAQSLSDPSFAQMVPMFELRKTADPGLIYMEKDTLQVWVQHFKPNGILSERAADADIIITCYPEYVPIEIRGNHVFPFSSGLVFVMQYRSFLLVEDRLDFRTSAFVTWSYYTWSQ